MERLTARNSIGQVYFPHCFREDTCDGEGASDKCNVCDFNQKIANALAAFEDLQDMLGIPFESLVELCKEEIPDECKNPSKAIILTDESVDEWQQYKALKEAMRKDYGLEIDMDIRTIRKAERTKTIDEFAAALVKHTRKIPSRVLGGANILEIAEQMKAGGENE